ncbi:MAG TPA: ABC transporter permease [Gemmatimonadales bacterium]|jgi:ABC-2 type transport system permease protein|nr:ABC transporter permease [Gemmatimonadales bacterium]
MRNHPVVQLTVSRVREFYREPEAIFWVFGFPIVLAAALGLAFRNKGPGAITVGVLVGSGDSAAVSALKPDSALRPVILDSTEAGARLRSGRIAILVVPGNPVVYRFDPTRDESRPAQLAVDRALQRAAGRADPVATRSDHVTAPGSRYIDFLIPGLLGMNLLGSGIWGVGFAVVTARQKKLLKRFMATPMRKSHYLLGFILSRLVFLVVEVAALVGFGWLIFGVGVRGSWLSLAGVALLGSLAFSGLGLLIASRARTVEGVSGLMNLAMLPMWILSGTFFSYSRFPDVMLPFVKALPLTALNDSLRAIMIDGTSIFRLGSGLAVVAVWGVACFGVALKIFRWR